MGNLFSSFDPTTSIFNIRLRLNWIAIARPFILIPQLFWLGGSQLTKSFQGLATYLMSELGALFGPSVTPGTFSIFIRLFLLVFFSNFIGLTPYVFTRSSHLVITLRIGLPLWVGSIVWSLIFQPIRVLSHLVPLGTPHVLMPFMVLIERVSNVIRPGTLSIRLAANIVAGHLLLTLLGSQGPSIGSYLIFLGLALFMLLLLEVGVACIQAYVFTILSSLYVSELMRTSFNKQLRR